MDPVVLAFCLIALAVIWGGGGTVALAVWHMQRGAHPLPVPRTLVNVWLVVLLAVCLGLTVFFALFAAGAVRR